jgi:predicted PurR-regulated permease PerM
MRLIIIALLVGIFGPIATLILERHMTNAPEWVWRIAYISCIFAGVSIAILSEPIYSRLKSPQASPVFTTIIVSILAAIIFGGVWWFFIAQNTNTYYGSNSNMLSKEGIHVKLSEHWLNISGLSKMVETRGDTAIYT